MKFFRFYIKVFSVIILFFLLVYVALFSTGNMHLLKAVRSTYFVGKSGPTITDNNKFENRTVKANTAVEIEKTSFQKKITDSLLVKCKEWETVAFLVIQNRKIIYENYWDGFNDKSLSNSFSMAKTFTSLAIGSAIQNGYIKSVKEPISNYLDEFNTKEKKNITIENLLQMSSGLDFGESYGDPFGFMAKTYYGKSIYDITINKPKKLAPGIVWKYQGGNSLLLSFVLEKATGKSLSDYFSDNIWSKIGAREDALWTLSENDKKEKDYCCFYSNARDFAKIGLLLLDSGKVNKEQIIDSTFFANSIKPVNLPDDYGKTIDYYGYQIWLNKYNNRTYYYARGILGQYIVVIPELDLVFVRLGHKRDNTRNVEVPKDLFLYLDMVESLVK